VAETERVAEIGVGVFSIPEATEILARAHGVTRRVVSSWLVRGLTFGRYDDNGRYWLAFDDLVSLKVVAELRDAGLSSQGLLRLEQEMRAKFPTLVSPLASVGVFFTNGTAVWVQFEAQVIEILGKYPQQGVLHEKLLPLVAEIRTDDDGILAASWSLSPHVEINPKVRFGRPVVINSRVPVKTVLANLESHTPEQVADLLSLPVRDVKGVQEYALAS